MEGRDVSRWQKAMKEASKETQGDESEPGVNEKKRAKSDGG